MRGNRVVLLVILLILLLGLAYFTTNPEQGRAVLVDLGLAEPEAGNYVVSGILEATVYSLGAVSGGRVMSLHAEIGDSVDSGQVLATLDASFIEAQIDAARAQVDAAQALLHILEDTPRPVDLAVAQASVDLAQTALDAARQAADDVRQTAPAAIRNEQAALADAAVESAQANLDAAQAALEALKDGASQSDFDAAQAAVKAAQAHLDALQAELDAMSITSPIDGLILDRLLLPGELALPGWPILTLADLSQLELTVYIPEADLNWVKIGQNVTMKVDAYPDRDFHGQVVFIADQAEFTPRNVQTPNERVILVYAVKILLSNPDGALKPGLPADAVFEVQP